MCWTDRHAGEQCAFGHSRKTFRTRNECVEANGGEIDRKIKQGWVIKQAICFNWWGEN
jgi:hypothetical protein